MSQGSSRATFKPSPSNLHRTKFSTQNDRCLSATGLPSGSLSHSLGFRLLGSSTPIGTLAPSIRFLSDDSLLLEWESFRPSCSWWDPPPKVDVYISFLYVVLVIVNNGPHPNCTLRLITFQCIQSCCVNYVGKK